MDVVVHVGGCLSAVRIELLAPEEAYASHIFSAGGTFRSGHGAALFSIGTGALSAHARQLHGRSRIVSNCADLRRPCAVWSQLLHFQIWSNQKDRAHHADNELSCAVSACANPASGDGPREIRTVHANTLHRIRTACGYPHHRCLLLVGNELAVGTACQWRLAVHRAAGHSPNSRSFVMAQTVYLSSLIGLVPDPPSSFDLIS